MIDTLHQLAIKIEIVLSRASSQSVKIHSEKHIH